MSQNHIVKIEDTDDDGSFLCPECKNRLSPDDENMEKYAVMESGFDEERNFYVLLICHCGALIKLLGKEVK